MLGPQAASPPPNCMVPAGQRAAGGAAGAWRPVLPRGRARVCLHAWMCASVHAYAYVSIDIHTYA